jgi:glycosyltransferase involved in cell wall biosynthesis
MSNVLYVAPYRQNDGWGAASRDYMRSISYACEKIGHNLTARPIFLSNNIEHSIENDILSIENNKLSNIDIIIQKALPQAICPIYPYKNIALCVFEQTNLKHSSYIKQIFNRMDHVCVPSSIEQQALSISEIKTPIHRISQPINHKEINTIISSVSKDDSNFLSLNTKYKDFTKFYFIGSFVPRKNIVNLILAFHYEFQSREKAMLVIKTDKMDNGQKEKIIQNINDTIGVSKYKKQLNKNLVFIAETFDRTSLLRLHYNCNIFVCPSKGEAFCRPLAEAIAIGNTPMAVQNTGAAELIDTSINGIVIPSRPEMSECNPSNASLDHECELEISQEPTILDLRKSLRQAHESYQDLTLEQKNTNKENLKTYSHLFSIENIGEKLCSLDIM